MQTYHRNEETVEPVEILDCGAGRVSCEDCEGTGILLKPDDKGISCTCCKGTGFILISAW